MGLQNQTPEQIAVNLAKAKAARTAAVAARRSSTLRTDFLDSSTWDDLARERKLRLPPWGMACTVSRMRTWLHKVGMSQRNWENNNGCKLAQFPERNPDWPMRAFAGLTLEK
jgi:hypothetical protein